jgi:processive 1,2-diacylglycerol beta-glucosyltransferase
MLCDRRVRSHELPAEMTATGGATSAGGKAAAPAVRVLVLTAPVAEGHLAAARVLAEDVRRVNDRAEVVVRDALRALPRPLTWLLHDAYRWQLDAAPWMFALLFGALGHSRVLRWLSRALLALTGSRGLMRLVRQYQADVIVSTWPVATMILGSLRRRGKVSVPVCATITDFAGLELWADRGVDLHLVMHESLVPVVESVAGRGSAHVVSPLVSSQFRTPGSAADSRRALGLPADGTIIVVSGGGWGVGDLEGAAHAALEIGAFVVCLAGRDEAVRARLQNAFEHDPRVRVLGFTERMSDLLAAANVLVHSTGGVTCLEALTCGCPIVAYGAPPGHAPSGARAMSALGLADHVRSKTELQAALRAAIRRPAVLLAQRADAANVILGAAPRVAVRMRARMGRIAVGTCALSIALFALLSSDATYPVVAEALALPEATSVEPSHDSVALVVLGARRDLLQLAPFARRNDLQASVATSDALARRDVATLRAAHLDPIPELQAQGVASWFRAREQVESQAVRYRLPGRFYYLAPKEGFTIVGYLLAHHLGGTPVQAQEDVLAPGQDFASLHAGEVLIATLGSKRGHDPLHLLAAIRSLERAGLSVASIPRLTSAWTSS